MFSVETGSPFKKQTEELEKYAEALFSRDKKNNTSKPPKMQFNFFLIQICLRKQASK